MRGPGRFALCEEGRELLVITKEAGMWTDDLGGGPWASFDAAMVAVGEMARQADAAVAAQEGLPR